MKKLLIILVALTSACTFRYDFNECNNDEDCTKFATGTQLLSCESNQCVVTGEAQECTTDADCIDDAPRTVCSSNVCTEPNDVPDMAEEDTNTPDMGDEDMPDNRVPCNTNAECNVGAASLDEWDSLCVEAFCTTALNAECTELGGELDANQTVLIGVILPMSDFNIGPPLRNSIELAVEEFNLAGGLPGGRRLTYVVCDDQGSSDVAVTNAEHLINELKTPAILGPLFSQALIDVATNVAIEAGTVLMSPAASADNVTNLVDNNLVWRVISSDRWQANAIADRVVELGATRIGIFYKDDTYGNGLQVSVFQELTTRVGLQAANVRAAPYPDPAAQGLDDNQLIAAWQTELASVRQGGFQPDMYLFIGTTEAVTLMGAYYSTEPALPIVVSHGGAPGLPVLIGNVPALQPLATAVGPNIFNGANFTQYVGRYAGKFPGDNFLTISTLTYDATLALAFAMVPIDQGTPITGTEIASNMPNIADKAATPVTAQGAFIGEAINELATGGNIDYSGVSGELDFNEDGDVRSDYLRFIAADDGNNNWTLDANAVYLYGTPPNPVGFWRLRCGAAYPATDCSVQTPGPQACIPGQDICLEVGCDGGGNMCDDGQCLPGNGGICIP